jgi:hypothetical protein
MEEASKGMQKGNNLVFLTNPFLPQQEEISDSLVEH